MGLARFSRLRSLLPEGVDGVLITDGANRRYYSGYSDEDHGPEESAGILLIGRASADLYTSPNNVEWAVAEAPDCIVHPWEWPWTTGLGKELVERGWGRVGFEAGSMSVAVHERLKGEAPAIEWIDVGTITTHPRRCKDESEIAAMRRAFRVTDDVFLEATTGKLVGVRERVLARRIEDAMRAAGAEGPAFPTIVASGPHAARPHHRVTDREIGEGEPVVIDMGARVDGYCADLTRTLCAGPPPPRFIAVYNALLTAQGVALRMIGPGADTAAIDRAAREAISDDGLGDGIVHGLGHGVGLRIHEKPSLSIHVEDELEAGNVVTVEPGVYFSDWGGVRIEDVVLVTGTGYELLTAAPKYTFGEMA